MPVPPKKPFSCLTHLTATLNGRQAEAGSTLALSFNGIPFVVELGVPTAVELDLPPVGRVQL